ncbi:hypothetical protein HGRIS_001748 [Hohenbuehelia grisea]|uniref:Secreted protein n=1 Tax=Hohenbuehelia grisea TaxID=104357 RepID=A0ABR3JIQ8_9AGAR
MVHSCMNFVSVAILLCASYQSLAAPVENVPEGILGWNPRFGHGPAVPSKSTKSSEEAGIPGWNPRFGHGPVLPSESTQSSEEPGIPGWNPRFGHGPVVPPEISYRRSNPDAIDYLPSFGNRHSAATVQENMPPESIVNLPGFGDRPVATLKITKRANPDAIDHLPGFGGRPAAPYQDSTARPENSEFESSGIPGWNPRFGHGPVIPSDNKWSNPHGIDYLPGHGGRPQPTPA